MKGKFDPALLLREDLRQLKPYQPHHYPGAIKLDANENPYSFPPEAVADLEKMLPQIAVTRYPDPMSEALRQNIAQYARVKVEQVMVGNGSDELILNLALAFGSHSQVVISVPTFSMYQIHTTIAGGKIVEVAREKDFTLNPQKLIKEAQENKAGMVVLCSPNNPTGNATSLTVIEEILANTQAVVVVDQAYLEFGGEDCAPLLAKYPNLVILRTFSKAFALAGLRVGYLLGSPDLINELLRIKQPYNVNVFSQTAAIVALKYLPVFQKQWLQMQKEVDRLVKELSLMPDLKVYQTDANFILIQAEMGSVVLHQKLLAQNILIRNLGQDLTNFLRVSVGTAEENRKLLVAMAEICGEVK